MSDYNDYITAVNKIFDYLNKMKIGWNNIDNKNHIESIEDYKQIVIDNLNRFKVNEIPKPKEEKLEELGND